MTLRRGRDLEARPGGRTGRWGEVSGNCKHNTLDMGSSTYYFASLGIMWAPVVMEENNIIITEPRTRTFHVFHNTIICRIALVQ